MTFALGIVRKEKEIVHVPRFEKCLRPGGQVVRVVRRLRIDIQPENLKTIGKTSGE